MDKTTLLKKLQVILDDAERTRMFGQIEIDVRDGRAVVLRTTKTDRLDGEYPRSNAQR
jgi:hypothetical protein